MKLKKILTNVVVLAITGIVSLLFCELASRIFLNPADYLNVGMLKDPILGATPSPTARSGFDKLGFRNREVPETAEVIAIGDSQTYGNAATMDDSWPYALGRMIGRPVYNMGLGGYGPNQYLEMLRTKALPLKPKLILCGLSITDDFDNAFQLTYGLDHWAYLRTLPDVKIDFDTWDTDVEPNPAWHKKIRVWLSQHSVVYQLVFHTGLGDRLKGKVQIRNAAQLYPGMATALIVPDKNIEEAFQPTGNLRRLDQDSRNVKEGMRITFELLKGMNEICKKNHIQFIVVVIPTKEMAFQQDLENASTIPLHDVVSKLLVNERLALDKIFKFLKDSDIPYVDPVPAMQAASGNKLFSASSGDMHPNKNGYRVIAQSVADALKQQNAGTK